jgi:hypothetical protein
MKNIQPLVLTPHHYPTESLLGYTLRIAERNGYDTPWHVMTHAGLSQRNMDTAGFSYKKLAIILARDANELEPISYYKVLGDGKYEFKLLGHSFGQSLKFRPLCLTKPQFCAHCAKENGFLDAFWDLSFAVACPIHRRTLADTCPTCSKRIKWFRPGILTCKCGASLEDATTENVSNELASMMALIHAKVHNKPIGAIDNSCGLPINELGSLPLRSLLLLIDTLGRHNMSENGNIVDAPMSIVLSAIEVLRNWPNDYHEFLQRIDKGNLQAEERAIGLRKRFKKLYFSLFKRNRPLEGVDFLRQEFVRFGLQEWGEGVVDNKLLRGELIYKRFVSLSEQARRMGVWRTTLKRWIEKGVVQMSTVNVGNRRRHVIDSNAVKLKKAEGKVLGDRAAASFVGLPPGVLKSLRNSGHYKVRHVTPRLASFHEVDLDSFIRSLCSMGSVVAERPEDSMFLGDVIRLQFRSIEGKADFIREVLSKNMKVIGRTGDSPVDLLFQREEVEVFLRDKRAEAENGTWSLSEAAKYLCSDPGVIRTIIDEGLLGSVKAPNGMRVTEKSVKDFDAKFVSVAKLTKIIGTSSTRLQKEIAKQNIPLKKFRRRYCYIDQPFVSREYDNLLTGILENLKATSTAIALTQFV